MTMATAGNALWLTLAERRGTHKSEFLESGDVAKWVARKRAVVNIWNWSAQPVMKGASEPTACHDRAWPTPPDPSRPDAPLGEGH